MLYARLIESFCSRDLDMMQTRPVEVDAEEDWLCPECDAPYSVPGIEADLVAYVGSHFAAAARWSREQYRTSSCIQEQRRAVGNS